MKYVKESLVVILGISTVLGLVFSVPNARWYYLLPAVLIVGLIVPKVGPTFKWIIDARAALANRDTLLAAVASAQRREKDLRELVERSQARALSAVEAAWCRGALAAWTVYQNSDAGVELKFLGAGVRDGKIVVMAEPIDKSLPLVGSIYVCRSSVLQHRHGLIWVTEYSDDGEHVVLERLENEPDTDWDVVEEKISRLVEVNEGLSISLPSLADLAKKEEL